MTTTPEGLVVVDKPSGWTSHDVVARIRRLAATKKVGHAGTLDPMATGVLVVGIGRATRLMGHLQLADKEYDATIRLGQSTVTDDSEGEVVSAADASDLTMDQIRAAMSLFRGAVHQVPSAVSAIKVDGKRSYARVRAGEDVVLPARKVTVSAFEALDARADGRRLDVDVHVACSSGTYVRALARDLGAALGVGGHLTMLRRTRVGGFDLSDARTLERLEEAVVPISMDEAVRAAFPVLELDEANARRVRHGGKLEGFDLGHAGAVALYSPDGTFLALYEQRKATARPLAVFV